MRKLIKFILDLKPLKIKTTFHEDCFYISFETNLYSEYIVIDGNYNEKLYSIENYIHNDLKLIGLTESELIEILKKRYLEE